MRSSLKGEGMFCRLRTRQRMQERRMGGGKGHRKRWASAVYEVTELTDPCTHVADVRVQGLLRCAQGRSAVDWEGRQSGERAVVHEPAPALTAVSSTSSAVNDSPNCRIATRPLPTPVVRSPLRLPADTAHWLPCLRQHPRPTGFLLCSRPVTPLPCYYPLLHASSPSKLYAVPCARTAVWIACVPLVSPCVVSVAVHCNQPVCALRDDESTTRPRS